MTDNELIYLYKTECLNGAKDIILNKHLHNLTLNTTRKVRKNFSTLYDLETQDFNGVVYMSLVNTAKNFNLKQCKYNFQQAMNVKAYTDSANYAKKVLCMNSDALNYSSSYDENERRLEISSYISAVEEEEQEDNRVNLLNSYLANEKNIVKKIIEYKSKGLRNSQISEITGYSSKQISNLFYNFVQKFRMKYDIQC
ncbi:MAG: hypothetical protein LBM76_01310 [Mycoplasmataceae bacterium]|jgi:hypothetical protein|nr:hypothetical protein [Mycoplasmataceae bacterium]